MPDTRVSIDGTRFLINEEPTYSDIPDSNPSAHGLLMNARFIQGIFDDAADPERFARFGHDSWDPEVNTGNLIRALPEWYRWGLRAFTVGIQGGGPCFTIRNETIENNPFGEDGTAIDPAYLSRLDRLIRAADSIGMVVIVSYFYAAQAARIRDGIGIRNAVAAASRFLRDGGYTNVLIEVANEHDLGGYSGHPIIRTSEGMASLIDLARRESGGIPAGCSRVGGSRNREVSEASDYVLIHGNGCSRQQFRSIIKDVQTWTPDRPIVNNEDSQALSRIPVALSSGVSWGYYNNMTKQEPPTDWSITEGEDRFFAMRIAQSIGIPFDRPEEEECFYFQGFEKNRGCSGRYWPRLASLNPEQIDYVEFFRNGTLVDTCYDDPFAVHMKSNWEFHGIEAEAGEDWEARIMMRDGRRVIRTASVE